MSEDESRSRALRGTALGLANGLSLVLLAILATAYGTETAVPFTSVDAFLAVATVWMSGPTGAGPAWAFGYLGVFVAIASPVWAFLVRPTVGDALPFGFSTEQGRDSKKEPEHAEGGVEARVEEMDADGEAESERADDGDEEDHPPTEEDETDFIWGSTSNESTGVTRDNPEEDTGFVWEDSHET